MIFKTYLNCKGISIDEALVDCPVSLLNKRWNQWSWAHVDLTGQCLASRCMPLNTLICKDYYRLIPPYQFTHIVDASFSDSSIDKTHLQIKLRLDDYYSRIFWKITDSSQVVCQDHYRNRGYASQS